MLRGYSDFLFQDKSGAIFRRDLPRLVGPAMTIILMDIAPVCLASNGNVQAFAAVDRLDVITAWGGRNGLGIGLFLEDVPGGIRMREGVVVGVG